MAPVEPDKKSRILQIEGSDGKARVNTDAASIKALRQVEQNEEIRKMNREMIEKMNELQNDITRMKNQNNESNNERNYKINAIKKIEEVVNSEEERKNTGEGVLIHTRINSIKSINGVDTKGMSTDILKNERVSNRCLTYLNFKIRGIQAEDEAFAEIEKYQKKWLHDTSKESTNKERSSINIQMDNGGARTVASISFAGHCKAPVLELSTPVNLMAFNQSITAVEHYAVFVVAVTGTGHDKDGKAITSSREFRVTALITDTEQPLILGSEVIDQQNIVFMPKNRKAIFFHGEEHEMIVDMVSWDEVKEKFNNTGTKQHAIHIVTEKEKEVIKTKLDTYLNTKVKRNDEKFIAEKSEWSHEYELNE